MGTGDDKTDYAAMVAEAEASVAAVKDPELRRVAFEKILTTLLDGKQLKAQQHPSTQRRAARSGKTKAKRASGVNRQGPKAHVEKLIGDGFFKKQRTMAEVKAELANNGHHIALTSLSGPLQTLTQDRKLRRQKATANGNGSKQAFVYSNW
ncbi:MAG: hypothetical protein K2P94_14805 [Rhodospirillaceae bacterium]|nr:hypothetical protein [Rhodospirillaceae bacterium]